MKVLLAVDTKCINNSIESFFLGLFSAWQTLHKISENTGKDKLERKPIFWYILRRRSKGFSPYPKLLKRWCMKLEIWYKITKTYVTLYSKMDQIKFFKGCLPHILLGQFLNALSHMQFQRIYLKVPDFAQINLFQHFLST